MRVLVTGAAGFIERAPVQALLPNHDVTATDWQATASFLGKVRYFEGDLRDPLLREVILARSSEVVFHLSTVPGGAAESDPHTARSASVEANRAVFEAHGGHKAAGTLGFRHDGTSACWSRRFSHLLILIRTAVHETCHLS